MASTSTPTATHAPERFDPKVLIRFVLALPVFFALFMFLPAGDWTWPRGWSWAPPTPTSA